MCARILRDSTPMRELYLAFPFQVEAPRFHFEAPGSVIEPIRDQWPGSNTDSYGVQHWVHVGGEGWGITWTPLDTPMAELGGLWPGYVSGAHHGVRGPGYGHPFSAAGRARHAGTSMPWSAITTFGPTLSTCARRVPGAVPFTTHRGSWDPVRTQRSGWGADQPPLAVWMEGPQDGALPLAASWLQIDAPNVALLTFKAAEDDRGWILRLSEVSGCNTTARVSLSALTIRHPGRPTWLSRTSTLWTTQRTRSRSPCGPTPSTRFASRSSAKTHTSPVHIGPGLSGAPSATRTRSLLLQVCVGFPTPRTIPSP